MATFTAYTIPAANKNPEKVELPLNEPPPNFVRIKVKACGLCHSDTFTKFGAYPGLVLPRVPGHEIAGIVDAVGDGVKAWKIGDRVGLGWYGGHCGDCTTCRQGVFVVCDKMPTAGLHYDGGYGEYVIADANALAKIPDGLSFVEAAPMLCAGVTTYNGLRRTGALPGEVVAVQGIGGLGHLAIQFAHKMGYKVVVLSRGEEKRELAMKLGAHHYFDTEKDDIVAETAKLGGVKVLLATSTSPSAMSKALPTLGKLGVLVILGAGADDLAVNPIFLLSGMRRIQGHASGTAADSEDTLEFSVLTGVRSMNEVYPVAKTLEAFSRMESGKAKFRVVVSYE